MKIGILVLAAIFFASGVKNIKDSRVRGAVCAEEKAAARRRLFFGALMLFLGALIAIYYIATL